VSEGDWRLLEQWTGDMQPITYNAGRPVQTTLRLPTDRRNGIKADTGIFLQDRWTMSRLTWNLGLRYDWFIGETQESAVMPSRFNSGLTFGKCPDGKNDTRAGCVGTVQNWKDISPRVGCRDRSVRRRAYCHQGELREVCQRPADCHCERGQSGHRVRV
jgi:outer membrane receptor protein involved in Fe transport